MALFAVIALKESTSAVDSAVEKLPASNRHKIEPGKWIVDSLLTTARELATELGLLEAQTHVVLSIRGYSGRAQPDLWEWMAAKSV